MKKIFIVLMLAVFMAPSISFAMGRAPKEFKIQMKVDFGPAGKPAHEETMFVERGTTPKEAVSQVFPVLSGRGCCSLREVIGIDGVNIQPAENRWWICLVNGSKDVSPQKDKLQPGDTVEWRYIQDSQ